MAGGESLDKVREGMGLEPARPSLLDRASADAILQNRAITAQVCIKAAVKLVSASLVELKEHEVVPGLWGITTENAVRLARQLMAEADSYIYPKPQRRRARKPKKEATQ